MKSIHRLMVLTGFLAVASTAGAQVVTVPSVTVATFANGNGAGLSSKDLDALADGLAVQLVESSRYRVLERTLLPIPGNPKRPSVAAIRTAAKDAGLDFVITGTVSKYSEHRPAQGMPVVMPPIMMPGRAPAFAPMAMLARPRTVRYDYLRVSVEVLNAKTGERMRLETGTCPAPPRSPLGKVFNSSSINPAVTRVMTTIAQSLGRTGLQPSRDASADGHTPGDGRLPR